MSRHFTHPLLHSGKTITKEGFTRLVEEEIARQGENADWIVAVYTVLDQVVPAELAAHGVRLACAQFCSACCYQLITTCEGAANVMLDYLDDEVLGTIRAQVHRQFREQARDYKRVFRFNRGLNAGTLADEEDPNFTVDTSLALSPYWNKACPFLVNGSCSVYPVRPLCCRAHRSLRVCRSATEGVQPFDLEVETWAAELMAKYAIQETGCQKLRAINHWWEPRKT